MKNTLSLKLLVTPKGIASYCIESVSLRQLLDAAKRRKKTWSIEYRSPPIERKAELVLTHLGRAYPMTPKRYACLILDAE